ncbi:MAG TPA: universal stress protein [Chloroflexia bacterium]|nr:universal stress protein [Chloroflexia bacterium]
MTTIDNNKPLVVTALPQRSYQGPQTVLLATDGTGYANASVDLAINLAHHNGAQLIITYFADPNDPGAYEGMACQNNTEWHERGRNILQKTEERARAGGVENVKTVLEPNPLAETLPDLAARMGADMIVVASHLFGN